MASIGIVLERRVQLPLSDSSTPVHTWRSEALAYALQFKVLSFWLRWPWLATSGMSLPLWLSSVLVVSLSLMPGHKLLLLSINYDRLASQLQEWGNTLAF